MHQHPRQVAAAHLAQDPKITQLNHPELYKWYVDLKYSTK